MADKIVEVIGKGPVAFPDTMSDAEILEVLKRQHTPAKPGIIESFVGRGIETAKGVGALALDAAKSATTIEGQATFLPRLAKGMYEGAVDAGAGAIARQFPKGVDNLPEAELLTGAARAGAAAVPVIGPYVMNKVSDVEEGGWRKAVGESLFDVVAAGTAKAIPKAAPPALAKMRAMGRDLALDVRDVARSRGWGPIAAGAIGGAVGGPVGAAVGTATDLIYSTRYARKKKKLKANADAAADAFKKEADATDAVDARTAELAKREAELQAVRDTRMKEQLKWDRDQTFEQIKREEAVAKAREVDTIAAAKNNVKLIELDDATTARSIATAEKAAAKAEAAGQKFDQGLYKRQAAELAKQGKEALSERARVWKESQGSASFEVKILESSERAIAKTQAETAALAKKMETQAGAELAASVKKMDELHRRAYVEDGVRRRALERIEKKIQDKEAAKALKSSPAPASAAQTPATATPATPTFAEMVESTKAPVTAPDLAKARKSANQMVYSTDKSGKAYSVKAITDGLRRTYKDLPPETAAQIAKEVKAKAVHPETVAGGLANKDIGISQIANHLHDTYGIPTSKAVEAAFKEVQARGTAMTKAQRAEYLALKGKNLKKIGLDLKPRS